MSINIIYKKLENIKFIEAADMREYTSFRSGGKASLLILPSNVEELKRALKTIGESGKECLVIGNGSNLLIRDGGYEGIIVKLGEAFDFVEVNHEKHTVLAGAGALMSKVAREALASELTGFEFAGGIPGTMGGALFMNAGAYGGEMANIVKEASVVSKDGSREYIIGKDEMELAYRESLFEKTGDIITSVTLQLERGQRDEISESMTKLKNSRNEKQPVNIPSAGSFFKRPTGNFAGKLIEEAKLKGLKVGGARVSPLHAGFIVNEGNATAQDIISLMKIIQNTVYDKTGIMLEPEVKIIGGDKKYKDK